MNRFFPLLLALLLLCGCAAQDPVPLPAEVPSAEEAARVVPFLAPVEGSQNAPQFDLAEAVTGFLPMDNKLLFFSEKEPTILTLADPDTLQILGSHETGMVLSPENGTIQLLEEGLSYFSSPAEETVILDKSLREIRRITAPEDLVGMPLLSRDGNTLYYATPSAIRALDTASGISRILREAAYPVQGLSGLLLEDSVLRLSITEADGTWRTLFLSSDTGQLLADHAGNILPETIGQRYCLRQQKGIQTTFLFGTGGNDPVVLKPWFSVEDSFFLGDQILTTSWNQDRMELHLYSLDSGMRIAFFGGFPPGVTIRDAAQGSDGHIWLLCDQQDNSVLYRWDPNATNIKDNTNYISPRYTRQEPDLDALAACTLYAREISHRHGVEVLVYTDAVALEPWDYELEYEYDAPALYQELELLDRRLSSYPSGFLQTLSSKFDGIRLCIVRQIRGTPESGSVDIANGIQFWDGYTACIVLAAGHDTERALYHELCHLIDTVVLTESTAYDQWNKLNPQGFQYANASAHSMRADDWRQAGWESFLDDYSMSYAKEDRARIMEYAMTAGNAERFESPYLQAKLQLLCTGIREAFGLEDAADAFLWEQYLDIPIAAAN